MSSEQARDSPALCVNGVNAKEPCKRWRHIDRADDGFPVDSSVEVRSPKNAGDAMCAVEAVGVVELAVRVQLVVSSKFRSNDNGCVVVEIRITPDPIKDLADRMVRCSYRT